MEEIDADINITTSSSGFTFTEAGTYEVTVVIRAYKEGGSVATFWDIAFAVNGITDLGRVASSTVPNSAGLNEFDSIYLSAVTVFSAGDALQVVGRSKDAPLNEMVCIASGTYITIKKLNIND